MTRGINRPPYTAPTHVIYPPEAVPNPYVGDMAVQPVFDNLPAACLYRPDKLPVDMDNRLHVGSVWMGVEKDSCECSLHGPVQSPLYTRWIYCQ